MHELAMTPQIRDARERVRAFMEEYVYPNEAALGREDAEAEALLKDLRARAKAAGLWAPFIGPEAGGSGLGFLPYAYLNEIIGRSHFAPLVFGCHAPGVRIIRAIPVFGHRGSGWNTHCEVRFEGARVPLANLLGERGDGFRIAQRRLGPGRIHHVMRWLGQMQRAFELLCRRALEREAFGGPLADKQTVQNWIADSAAEIQACRLLTLDAAYRIDQGDEARVEISAVKFYAARVLHDVIDRAVQVHGALGLTDHTPLSEMYRQARAARVYDGPDEVHRMVVSRRILRAFAAGTPWDFAAGGPAPAAAASGAPGQP